MKSIFALNKLIVIPLALFANIANGAGPEPGVTDTEVVIGAHTAESGKAAGSIAYPAAIRAYFDDINKKGGVNGRKINFIGIDTSNLQMKTVQATHTLVEQNNIFAMVGAQGVSHAAVWKYLMERNIPDMYFHDVLTEYAIPVKKTVFTGWYVDSLEGALQGEYIAKKFKGKKVCWLSYDGAQAEQWVQGAKDAIQKANTKLGDKEKIIIGPVENTDRLATQANSEVLKLRRENCEIVMLHIYQSIAPSAVNFATSQGYSPKWITFWNNVSPAFIKLLTKPIKDDFVTATFPFAVEEGLGAKDFGIYKAFCDAHKLEVGGYSAKGYSVAEMFVETLKRAGRDLTREKLVKAAESLGGWQCSLCARPTDLSPTEHQPVTKPIWLTIKGGKWALLKE